MSNTHESTSWFVFVVLIRISQQYSCIKGAKVFRCSVPQIDRLLILLTKLHNTNQAICQSPQIGYLLKTTKNGTYLYFGSHCSIGSFCLTFLAEQHFFNLPLQSQLWHTRLISCATSQQHAAHS